MSPRRATLSLDLDNLWSYQKTHGDPGWQSFPSYLEVVVPRVLELLDEVSVTITVFVVGQDAELPSNHAALRSIVAAGHEIANHSFHHEPWLHLYPAAQVRDEIERAEFAIFSATGVHPRGFRGPGYSVSETVLRELAYRGYAYDCSTFPTSVGPLARAYYFLRAHLDHDQKQQRRALFGGLRDGLRPLRPYQWDLGGSKLLEIPVTTMPGTRLPIHFSYLHWMAGSSERLAKSYFAGSLRACAIARVEPSLLLHPLDFLGRDDVSELAFFPAMDQSGAEKVARMRRLLAILVDRFDVDSMGACANRLSQSNLRLRRPDFGKGAEAYLDPSLTGADRP